MDPFKLNAKAEALWNAMDGRACLPDWDQLGETTRDVWREKVLAKQTKGTNMKQPEDTTTMRLPLEGESFGGGDFLADISEPLPEAATEASWLMVPGADHGRDGQ